MIKSKKLVYILKNSWFIVLALDISTQKNLIQNFPFVNHFQ